MMRKYALPVAKLFGPLIFGRGRCGYACWTAMVLDFLPYKTPRAPRRKLGWIRFATFAASLAFVAALFLARVGNLERIMFRAFIVGNVAYYAVGIVLAFAFRDNRAFCKYICPVTVFLKPMSFLFARAGEARQGQMCRLRQVQARLPDGCGCHGQFAKAEKRHGMHPLHGMREELPQGSALTAV